MNNTTLYTYADLMKDRNNFRMVDYTGSGRYDNPSSLFFKLVFYFSDSYGLLGSEEIDLFGENETETSIKNRTAAYTNPTPNDITNGEDGNSVRKRVYQNTALNYLLLNDELERAELLKKFIILLSSINCDSPWYFSEINGIDTALERKIFSEDFKIDEKPKQLTIKCLNDAYDDRIGTLLDLYRAVCFSYQGKKEIIPANLRKFNMGVLVFNAPIRGKGGKSGTKNNAIRIPETNESYYIPSIKLIEFRNCEFDYNSSKTAWGTLDAKEFLSPAYTITINYDDAYETRYNEIMGNIISDYISIDVLGERKDRSLSDINRSGKDASIDDTGTLSFEKSGKKLDAKGNQYDPDKSYWTDTYAQQTFDPYSRAAKTKAKETIEFEKANGPFTNLVSSRLKNLSDDIGKITDLPEVSFADNIHDYGTVQNYGEFEYLNRTSGTDGMIGTLAGQAIGAAVKPVKSVIKKLYLGNIHGFSMRDVLSKTNQVISGDISGMAASSIRESKKETETVSSSVNSKLSGYDKERTEFIGKLNKGKSLRNNL